MKKQGDGCEAVIPSGEKRAVSLRKKSTKRVVFKRALMLLLIIVFLHSAYGVYKPLPEGISIEGQVHSTADIEFLYDLTYESSSGEIVREQVIFDRIFAMIDQAEEFILADMFLWNDDYERSASYPPLSSQLAEALIEKKRRNPDMTIVVMTDPINTFYGSYAPDHLQRVEEHGIHLIYTDLTPLRDSNPSYSGLWRTLFRWFGTAGTGWMPNPFSPDSPDVTLRSYLELLNFKANHRKVLITDKEAIVTSANPHDASAHHSNIAFVVKGDIVRELAEAEKMAAMMSGADPDWFDWTIQASDDSAETDAYEVQLLTEGKIKAHLLEEIAGTQSGDRVWIGVFYLSDRDVIKALLQAAERNADVRLILDANKDAFGREKNGVPNRPAAHELLRKSDERIQIRWYNTNGEQFHTKMALFESEKKAVLIGGSANFTKRNLDDLNLETNLKISGKPEQAAMQQAINYFEMLWSNDGGIYTLDYEHYADESMLSKWLYRFQEWSGMSTF